MFSVGFLFALFKLAISIFPIISLGSVSSVYDAEYPVPEEFVSRSIVKTSNGLHKTITNLPLKIGSNVYGRIYIGDYEFFWELLHQSNSNDVLLVIEYEDDVENRKIKKYHEEKLIKYIEGCVILGYDNRFMPDFEYEPEKFFEIEYRNNDGWTDSGR